MAASSLEAVFVSDPGQSNGGTIGSSVSIVSRSHHNLAVVLKVWLQVALLAVSLTVGRLVGKLVTTVRVVDLRLGHNWDVLPWCEDLIGLEDKGSGGGSDGLWPVDDGDRSELRLLLVVLVFI